MVKLILKSPYIKPGGRAGRYAKYIATRENVQKLADDRPATQSQEKLIKSILKDFPETKSMYEYEDMEMCRTKANASAFITAALRENMDEAEKREGYMSYIAERPRVERIGTHGLFGNEDFVDLDKAMDELNNCQSNVWTHIISLRREDATSLGYDNANAWRNVIKANTCTIASAMNIPINNFRWYAAFHDEGDHPHVHMMAWSSEPSQGYLDKDGIEKIRSKLTNDIFKQEMMHLYQEKTMSRDELVEEARQKLQDITFDMKQKEYDEPEIADQLMALSVKLKTIDGKMQYGYLPKPVKKMVDEIVDSIEKVPEVHDCYETWVKLQDELCGYYTGEFRQRVPLSMEKEFISIRNAVVSAAVSLSEQVSVARHVSATNVAQQMSTQHASVEAKPVIASPALAAIAVAALMMSVANTFSTCVKAKPRMRIDSKRLEKLMELAAAHGQRDIPGMHEYEMEMKGY